MGFVYMSRVSRGISWAPGVKEAVTVGPGKRNERLLHARKGSGAPVLYLVVSVSRVYGEGEVEGKRGGVQGIEVVCGGVCDFIGGGGGVGRWGKVVYEFVSEFVSE